MKGDPSIWVLARASGLTAYGLLTASVLAGLTVKGRPFGKLLRPASVTDIHGFLALLALGAVAAHGVALVADTVVTITPMALFVPGVIAYRPIWTSCGVVTAELMLVVYVSFSVRRWIGTAAWRRLHYMTYLLFAGATAHGLMSGTDTHNAWALKLYAGSIGLVAAATTWRVLGGSRSRRRPPARAALRAELPQAGRVT